MSRESRCQCAGPGYCPTHGREMSAVRFHECRHKPGFFEVFQQSKADSGKRKAEKPPSLWRRAQTAATAFGRWAKAGFPLADLRETRRRRTICNACDQQVGNVCLACGCFVKAKTKIATEACPLGKWGERKRKAESGERKAGTPTCGTCATSHTAQHAARTAYQALPPLGETGPIARNLLYHVWPVKENDLWRRNLVELLRRIDLFNGRRVCAIVTDAKSEPAGAVKAALAGLGFEFLEMPNKPRLREVVTFVPLLERVATTDPNAVTFYAHAKSVRHAPDSITWRWARAMYDLNLDHWPAVERRLRHWAMCGCFKKHGAFAPPIVGEDNHRWHYSGTFYWFRNAAVFAKDNWRDVDQFFAGAESWPGRHFASHETACLFHSGGLEIDLYQPAYWRDVIEPKLEQWKAQQQRTS